MALPQPRRHFSRGTSSPKTADSTSSKFIQLRDEQATICIESLKLLKICLQQSLSFALLLKAKRDCRQFQANLAASTHEFRTLEDQFATNLVLCCTHLSTSPFLLGCSSGNKREIQQKDLGGSPLPRHLLLIRLLHQKRTYGNIGASENSKSPHFL